MKDIDKTIEEKLKNAVESSVPDILPSLLQRLEEEGRKRKMSFIKRISLAVAASFILLLGAYTGYGHFALESVVGLDVNPSIELSLNKKDKVLRAEALNQEGLAVMGDMKLKNLDLDTALNALIGSMLKNGYIDEIKNSILITVDSNNVEKGIKLRDHLSLEVNKLLDEYSFKGAILGQALDRNRHNEHIKELSDKYGISYGKASFIDRLIKENPIVDYSEAAKMPINDLNLLISHHGSKLDGVSVQGKASNKGYIGEEKATSIAFKHANINETSLKSFEIEIDYEDGRMIYELEFKDENGSKYEYEIDAKNGNILEYEVEYKDGNKTIVTTPDKDKDKDKTNYIGSEKAIEIALKHAGFQRNDVRKLEWELDTEDGFLVYEIEFKHGEFEYEYDIDVYTGKIIDWEKELDD